MPTDSLRQCDGMFIDARAPEDVLIFMTSTDLLNVYLHIGKTPAETLDWLRDRVIRSLVEDKPHTIVFRNADDMAMYRHLATSLKSLLRCLEAVGCDMSNFQYNGTDITLADLRRDGLMRSLFSGWLR